MKNAKSTIDKIHAEQCDSIKNGKKTDIMKTIITGKLQHLKYIMRNQQMFLQCILQSKVMGK